MLRAEWNELIQMTVASCGLERAPSYEGCFMLQLKLFLLAGARRAFRSIAVQVFGRFWARSRVHFGLNFDRFELILASFLVILSSFRCSWGGLGGPGSKS